MRQLSQEEIEQIPLMVEQGKRMPEIAEHFGISPKTVQSWIKKYRNAGRALPILKGRPPMKLI